MPVPSHRLSKSRTRRRRSHADQFGALALSPCPKCKKLIFSHRACPYCGFYRGREIIDVLAKLTKKERKKREKEMKREEKMKKKEESRESDEK